MSEINKHNYYVETIFITFKKHISLCYCRCCLYHVAGRFFVMKENIFLSQIDLNAKMHSKKKITWRGDLETQLCAVDTLPSVCLYRLQNLCLLFKYLSQYVRSNAAPISRFISFILPTIILRVCINQKEVKRMKFIFRFGHLNAHRKDFTIANKRNAKFYAI